MATTSVFAGTGFSEFRCDCGAAFGDSLYNAVSHVVTWHCDPARIEDHKYFEGCVVTMISPNPIDFLPNDLEDSEG
jgi:hypothetical protein